MSDAAAHTPPVPYRLVTLLRLIGNQQNVCGLLFVTI